MRAGVLGDEVRRDSAQEVVRPRNRAIEQQQPCRLEVWYSTQLVPQLRLRSEAMLQEALPKLLTAKRSNEDDDAVPLGI